MTERTQSNNKEIMKCRFNCFYLNLTEAELWPP